MNKKAIIAAFLILTSTFACASRCNTFRSLEMPEDDGYIGHAEYGTTNTPYYSTECGYVYLTKNGKKVPIKKLISKLKLPSSISVTIIDKYTAYYEGTM